MENIEVGSLVNAPRYNADGTRYIMRGTVTAIVGHDGIGEIYAIRYRDGKHFVALECEVNLWSPYGVTHTH